MNYIEVSPEPCDVSIAFRNLINSLNSWLLVYDGLEYYNQDDYERILNVLPNNLDSHRNILITSRTFQAFDNVDPIRLDVFSVEEAKDYLRSYSGIDDPDGASQLAQLLDCYPLALEYAAAYIKETPGYDYGSYIELFTSVGPELLEEIAGVHKYQHTVKRSFDISYQAMLREAAISDPRFPEEIERLFDAISFMYPYGVDISLFNDPGWRQSETWRRSYASLMSRVEPDITFDQAKAKLDAALPPAPYLDFYQQTDIDKLTRLLKKYSFVYFSKRKMNFHPLMMDIRRESIADDKTKALSIIDQVLELYLFRIQILIRTEDVKRNPSLLLEYVPQLQTSATAYAPYLPASDVSGMRQAISIIRETLRPDLHKPATDLLQFLKEQILLPQSPSFRLVCLGILSYSISTLVLGQPEEPSLTKQLEDRLHRYNTDYSYPINLITHVYLRASTAIILYYSLGRIVAE